MHLDTELLELTGDDIRRTLFFKGNFGVGVNVMAPFGHLFMEFSNPVND